MPLFETDLEVRVGVDQYAVSRDGQRFLIATPADERNEVPASVVVQNWFTELERLVPTN